MHGQHPGIHGIAGVITRYKLAVRLQEGPSLRRIASAGRIPDGQREELAARALVDTGATRGQEVLQGRQLAFERLVATQVAEDVADRRLGEEHPDDIALHLRAPREVTGEHERLEQPPRSSIQRDQGAERRELVQGSATPGRI